MSRIELDYYADTPLGDDFNIPDYLELCANREVSEGRLPTVDDFYTLLADSAGRVALTKDDPLLFACVYLANKLSSAETGYQISQARFHMEQYEWARTGLVGQKKFAEERQAVVAGRGFGKSTVYFLILPLWALAHKHRRFVVAFADVADQALAHLANFRKQIDENAALRQDFPELCTPKKDNRGMSVSDTKRKYQSASGITFTCAGMDNGVRGLNDDGVRPDWIICDDIEPSEGNYSAYQASQRLSTLLEQVFYLNTSAVVSIVGTVTMDGSIIHQIKKSVTESEFPDWVKDARIKCHYYPAIYFDSEDDSWLSAWEARYPVADLIPIKDTASFLKEMMNDPRGNSGGYWEPSHFIYESLGDLAVRWILFIDPAVRPGKKTDDTGFCVAGFDPINGRVEIAECFGKKLTGAALAAEAARILARHPRIRKVICESNQGGDVWLDILKDLPVKVETQHTSKGKEFRFAEAVNHYDLRRVVHRKEFVELEGQMIGYPKALHDDIADAAVLAIEFLIGSGKPKPVKKKTSSRSYI